LAIFQTLNYFFEGFEAKNSSTTIKISGH